MQSIRRFTVDEYHRMGEAGILRDERVELLDGEVLRMSPIGSPHDAAVSKLGHLLIKPLDGHAIVRLQGSLRVDRFTELLPDVAVVRSRPDYYASRHPEPTDVLLLIEVAESSERYDRAVKAPLYGRAGVPETWVVLLNAGTVEVHRGPSGGGYVDVREAGPEDVLSPLALPDLRWAVRSILP